MTGASGPVIRITGGRATPEEAAAIVVVLRAKLASRRVASSDERADRRKLQRPAPFLPAHSWQSV